MIPSRLRTPNPHLGAYYGIVTSAFVSLIIILAMFEQLGWGRLLLAQCMMLVPLALYLLIAVGARTFEVEDYFVSGRRVPPVFNGFALAAVAVGGVGFLAYTGTVFFLGFDALAIGLGWTFGMLLAAILFVPYLRKAGSYTLPSFLGHRFRSRGLAHGGQRDAAAADRAARGRRDQDRRADRRAVPADLLLHRRAGACGADRGDRHSRRHAVADLDGKR